MNLVSDSILIDDGKKAPSFEAVFPKLKGFSLADPNAWTKGHPHDFYRRMREDAPVMWTPMRKSMSGFWSVTGYDDIKSVEQIGSLRKLTRFWIMPNARVPKLIS